MIDENCIATTELIVVTLVVLQMTNFEVAKCACLQFPVLRLLD